jgi:hypothetical protein
MDLDLCLRFLVLTSGSKGTDLAVSDILSIWSVFRNNLRALDKLLLKRFNLLREVESPSLFLLREAILGEAKEAGEAVLYKLTAREKVTGSKM